MAKTRINNRDLKDLGTRHSSRSFFAVIKNIRIRYWLLLGAVIATVSVVPDQHNSLRQAAQQPGTAVLSANAALGLNELQAAEFQASTQTPLKKVSLESIPAGSLPTVVTADQRITDKTVTMPDFLVHNSSGTPFSPLLEKSPALWKTNKIKKGDTLYLILKRLGLDTAAATLIAHSSNSKKLVKLIPGKTLHIFSKDGRSSDEFVYEDTPLTWVYAKRNGDSYEIISHKLPTTKHIRKVKGEVISSLYASAKVAGISDTLTMNMTEIFGWDIDFAINVQPGDRFKLIYEDIYVNGDKKSHGDILAAEFVNNGKTYRAIANRDEDGELRYYSPEGKSMQKAFLRTPVKFSRISSRFSRARYHPVLKKTRAHKGVDYAASEGTPVRSTANGTITHIGRKGGYGKAIIISHGSTYSTLYAHLSRYSRGIKKGSKVKQGQIIGRVGSTGLASGPHLHYEFRINGKHVNPLTFRQPSSEPIQQAQKADFERIAQYWEEQLDSIEGLTVAGIEASDG